MSTLFFFFVAGIQILHIHKRQFIILGFFFYSENIILRSQSDKTHNVRLHNDSNAVIDKCRFNKKKECWFKKKNEGKSWNGEKKKKRYIKSRPPAMMRIDKWYASIYLFFQYYLWNGSFEFMSTVDYFFYVHILRWHYMNQILTNILYRAPDKDSISAKISTFIMFLSCFLLFFFKS